LSASLAKSAILIYEQANNYGIINQHKCIYDVALLHWLVQN